MNVDINNKLSKVSSRYSMPFWVHKMKDDLTVIYENGESKIAELPDNISKHLDRINKIVIDSSKSYYLFNIGEVIVIINDNDYGENISKYIAALMAEPEKCEQCESFHSYLSYNEDELKQVVSKKNNYTIFLQQLNVPLYVVSYDYDIVNYNDAVYAYANIGKNESLLGKKCYSVLFDRDKPCEWCKINDVKKTKEYITSEVTKEIKGKIYHYDMDTFPLPSVYNDADVYGEIIYDKTEKVEMISTLNKFRTQLQNYKLEKIYNMNDIKNVEKAYADLLNEHELVLERNRTIIKAMETLMEQSQDSEIYDVKSELIYTRSKVARLEKVIKNYQDNIEMLKQRTSSLNKRAFCQVERMINIINSRMTGRHEFKKALDVLKVEVEEIKGYFKDINS